MIEVNRIGLRPKIQKDLIQGVGMLKTESFEFKDPRKPKIPNPMI
jgi:hypothetical protein